MTMGTGKVKRTASLPFQKLDDETLVVDPKSREVHLLNVTATRVWDLLDAARTPDEIVEALLGEYDCSRDELSADVDTLLEDFAAKGLVSRAKK